MEFLLFETRLIVARVQKVQFFLIFFSVRSVRSLIAFYLFIESLRFKSFLEFLYHFCL